MPKKSINYGTELEFFAGFLFKRLFTDLKGLTIQSNYFEFQIDDIKIGGSPKGGQQLTDIPLELYLKDNKKGIVKMRLYIEAKAYFANKDVSENELEGSVNGFFTKYDNILGYGDCYIIFKPGNKNINQGGRLETLLSKYCQGIDFVDYRFEISNTHFDKKEVGDVCENIKKHTLGKKYLDDTENKIIEGICNNYFDLKDLDPLKKYIVNELGLSLKQFEVSPKRLSTMLENTKKNKLSIKNIEDIISKESLRVEDCFYELSATDPDLTKSDYDISTEALFEYIGSKRSTFDTGYLYQKVELFENEISSQSQMSYMETKNPIKDLMGDFIDTIQSYITMFTIIDKSILDTIIMKNLQTRLGLIIYLGTLQKCHIQYERDERAFKVGPRKYV